jgi:hypothetical protein
MTVAAVTSVKWNHLRQMRLPVLLALPAALIAQSLRVSDSSTARGASGSFLIRLESSHSPAPSTLQWEVSLSKQVAVNLSDIVAGSSAEVAGKSIVCAAVTQNPQTSTYRCILSGGTRAIQNGPVAVVKYTIAKQVHPGATPVRITKALGVSKDAAKIDYPESEGRITIR